MVGTPGAYLVRESIGQPGDYAISYLSKTGTVHHFKINSNCGDYYIGGRQFFSLGDLIGFYANCSCILENESLEVPVVPPKVHNHSLLSSLPYCTLLPPASHPHCLSPLHSLTLTLPHPYTPSPLHSLTLTLSHPHPLLMHPCSFFLTLSLFSSTNY